MAPKTWPARSCHSVFAAEFQHQAELNHHAWMQAWKVVVSLVQPVHYMRLDRSQCHRMCKCRGLRLKDKGKQSNCSITKSVCLPWEGCSRTVVKEWDAEERFLFEEARVTACINFDEYDAIEVECIGGHGAEIPVKNFEEGAGKYALPTELVAEAIKPVAPVCIILAPVRNLCQHIVLGDWRLSFSSSFRCAAFFGDETAMIQLEQLAQSLDIAAAMPGRLDDFCSSRVITMENVEHLVVDEAERLLGVGFEPQIPNIIENYIIPQPGLDQGLFRDISTKRIRIRCALNDKVG